MHRGRGAERRRVRHAPLGAGGRSRPLGAAGGFGRTACAAGLLHGEARRHPLQHRPGQWRRLPRGGAVERPRRSDQDQHRTGAASEAPGGSQRSAGRAGARRGPRRSEASRLGAAAGARRRHRENRTEGGAPAVLQGERRDPLEGREAGRGGHRVHLAGQGQDPGRIRRAKKQGHRYRGQGRRSGGRGGRRPRHLQRHRHPGPRQAGRHQARQRLHHGVRAQQGHPGEGAAAWRAARRSPRSAAPTPSARSCTSRSARDRLPSIRCAICPRSELRAAPWRDR